MSKNFELLRQAGILGTGETLAPPVRQTPAPSPRPVRNQEQEEPEWLHGLHVVHKHWRLAAAFAALVTATTIIVTFAMKPVYEPVARIEVDPPGETFSLEGGSGTYNDAEYMETQAQNLKSDRLALDVIRRLHLDQRDPRGEGSQQAATAEGQAAERLNRILGSFHKHLTVQRDTASRLISVSYAANDPAAAALVTNTVVNAFIEDTYQDRHDAIMRSTEWLSRQLDDIRGRMGESNRALAEYQKSIGVADVDNNRNTFAEQISDLNRQLTQTQADRIQLEALLKSVRAGSPDVLPEVRNNPVVQQLSSRVAELRGELSQARVIYGVNHPNVRKLESQVNELQAQLDAQKAAVLGSIRTKYAAARAQEELMNSEIKGTASQLSQMARYNELKKEAQANSDLYNSLYAKVKEAGIAAASQSSNLRVVDEARVLNFPTRPNRLLNIVVGLFVGLVGGIALTFLREQFDTRIFTPDDVRDWFGTPNIAIVPQFFVSKGQQLPPANGDGTAIGKGYGRLAPGVRFLLDRPHSPEAEALRSLYTSIMLSRSGSAPQVLLVASSFPGEGKTTVAVNLAMAMAQHGTTCVVDADLRRGRVAAAFGISQATGLTDVLNGNAQLESVLVGVPSVANLTIIPAHAGSVNAGQLVCSDRMRTIVAELREKFQYVVIDSAPILPFADGRSLSTLADGLIFVGRSGMTTREVVQRSLELLNEVHAAPILEFVLNAADLNSAPYRYYQYGYEYDEASAR